jgi:branched-chain amino acid transport system permease protein
MDFVNFVGIFSILAISLNLEYGLTGLPNFGKAAFFMIGAYASALVTLNGGPYPLGLLAAIILSGTIGALVSIPALRLSPSYLAIVTLVFAEILRLIIKNEDWIAGGLLGLKGIPAAFPTSGVDYNLVLTGHAILIYSILGAVFLLTRRMSNSPFGRTIRAIREDEPATQGLGKDTVRCKVYVFAVGSAIAGIAGSLFAQYVGYVSSELFLMDITFRAYVMVVLGGAANLFGGIVGPSIFLIIERLMRIVKDYTGIPLDPNNLMFILSGILMVLILLFRPEGVLREKPVKTV